MRRLRDVLWSATLVVTAVGAVLGTGRLGRTVEFTPLPYTGGLLVRLALFVLLPLAVLTTVLASRRLAVKLGISPPRRRGAPKHAPPPDGPAA